MRPPLGLRRRPGVRHDIGLVVISLVLLLAGCLRHPPPARVAFPDDPRVLHGAWSARVTGLADRATGFVHAPDARRLVIRFYDRVEAYEADSGGGWSEYEPDFGSEASAGAYDPTLEAFVAVTPRGGEPRIRVTPIDGGPATESPIAIPAGHAIESVAIGSGRSFALGTAEAGGHELLWWDSLTGAFGGSRAVGSVRDGMRVSSNGRLIALWNLGAYRATLIDTAAPARHRILRLGACRSNGVTEASADGRWFLFVDCSGDLRLADLSTAEPRSEAIGIQQPADPRFAADTPEIVWVDGRGAIISYHARTGTKLELHRLSGTELVGFDPSRADVHLNRSADLLAVSTGRGSVRVQSVGTPTAATELPPPAIDSVALDLTVEPLDADGAESYDFTGTLTVQGGAVAGEALPITGSVFSDRLHEYVPSGSATRPAALSPPRLQGDAVARDPLGDEDRFHLTFSTTDREAVSFPGELYDAAAEIGYRVIVERTGAAGE